MNPKYKGKATTERPKRILLIENSVAVYNAILSQLSPHLNRDEMPYVDLVFSGEDRPAKQVDISADDAVKCFENGSFDLVITDLALRPVYAQTIREAFSEKDPDGDLSSVLDGLLVVTRLRMLSPDLPIIVFSRYATNEFIKRALRHMLNGFPENSITFLEKGENDYTRLKHYVLTHLNNVSDSHPVRIRRFSNRKFFDIIEMIIAGTEPPL